MLLVFCVSLGIPVAAEAAQTNASYYAIYCTGDKKNMTIKGGNHALIDCAGSGDPTVETEVKSLSTNPKGAHAVTVVEADCYPDQPSGKIQDGHIMCSGGPPATLTLGKHFAASKKAAAPKKKGKKKKKGGGSGGSKTKTDAPTAVNLSPIHSGGLPTTDADTDTVKTILQIVFGIIGAFALMSTVASGLKYVTSGGDPGKTSEAKKGIIFALVGLMIAISAQAIVAFVVHRGAP
jgi:hypothetical protein